MHIIIYFLHAPILAYSSYVAVSNYEGVVAKISCGRAANVSKIASYPMDQQPRVDAPHPLGISPGNFSSETLFP